MKLSVCLFVSLGLVGVFAGLIDHHERATSYQNIHIEHFHPVPTYLKKEHQQLLEHPVAIGQTSSKVEVHHGDKHDHGYAIQNLENNVHGLGDSGGFSGFEGHQEGISAGYQVHDHQTEEFQGQEEQELTAAHYPSSEGSELQYQHY